MKSYRLMRQHTASTILAVCILVAATAGAQEVKEVKTATTGDIEIPATGVQCPNGETRACAPKDCVQCHDLTVYLPLGAQVVRIRYYSTAGGPSGDVPLQEIQPGMSNWSDMVAAVQSSTPTNTVVQARFRNWSHNRTRKARIEVDWK